MLLHFCMVEWGDVTSHCDKLVSNREQRWGHEEKSLIVTQRQTDGKQAVATDASKTVKVLSRKKPAADQTDFGFILYYLLH